jgi:hypothetical protein
MFPPSEERDNFLALQRLGMTTLGHCRDQEGQRWDNAEAKKTNIGNRQMPVRPTLGYCRGQGGLLCGDQAGKHLKSPGWPRLCWPANNRRTGSHHYSSQWGHHCRGQGDWTCIAKQHYECQKAYSNVCEVNIQYWGRPWRPNWEMSMNIAKGNSTRSKEENIARRPGGLPWNV